MGTIGTGTFVATKLTVSKKANGANIGGYPKEYSILPKFSGFPSITIDMWQVSSVEEITARVDAFIIYVSQIEGIALASKITNPPITDTP